MELVSGVTYTRRIWILLLRVLWMLVSRDGSDRHCDCPFVIVLHATDHLGGKDTWKFENKYVFGVSD
jgi:hypothetical protein